MSYAATGQKETRPLANKMSQPATSAAALMGPQSSALAQMQEDANAQGKSAELAQLQSLANAPRQSNLTQLRPLPNVTGDDSIQLSEIATEDFAGWKAQDKGIHGAVSSGNRTFVAQFKSANPPVMQLMPKKLKASLLIAEGTLTMAAGIAAAVMTGGIAVIPAIIAAGVGALKFARGVIMLAAKDGPGKRAVLDAMRGLEGFGTVVAGALTGNPAIIVFGFAKLLRSLLMAIDAFFDDDTKHVTISKGLKILSSLLHAVEVAALGFAGYGLVEAGMAAGEHATVLGGLTKGAVAASKGVRAMGQFHEGVTHKPEEAPDDSGRSAPLLDDHDHPDQDIGDVEERLSPRPNPASLLEEPGHSDPIPIRRNPAPKDDDHAPMVGGPGRRSGLNIPPIPKESALVDSDSSDDGDSQRPLSEMSYEERMAAYGVSPDADGHMPPEAQPLLDK